MCAQKACLDLWSGAVACILGQEKLVPLIEFCSDEQATPSIEFCRFLPVVTLFILPVWYYY